MEMINLEIAGREQKGRRALERLRREERIPGVVYSEGKPAVMVSVAARDFRRHVSNASSTQIFSLKSDVKDLDGQIALVKDIQSEPLKDKVLHFDLLWLHEGHKVIVTVPVELVGECPAVKLGDAFLNHSLHELEIESLPREIPDFIEVDISKLEIGESIQASDLTLPAGAKLITEGKLSVVSAIEQQDQLEATASPEVEVEGAEGEAGEEGGDSQAAGAEKEEKKEE